MYDNTVSARTYLSYIAEQAGGIAVIGRDGKLYIKTIGESSATLPLKLFKTFKWGEKFKITRVRYDDGTQLFEKGDTTGNTVYISQDNMYIVDQEQIDNIYNALKDLEFYSFEGESIIDPALDTGDIVVIDGKNVIYQGSMQFSGRWIASIESKIQCKAKEETTRRTPSQKTINRRVESNINQINGKITKLVEETTENSQKITKTEQDVNGLTTKVSSVEQSVENITNTQNTATGKNIHLEDSSDDPLVSIKVKGSTKQATRSGKNLYNKGNVSGTRMLKVPINELLAGTYTLSAVATSSDTDRTQCLVYDATNNKPLGYLKRNVRSSFIFTLAKPTKKLNFYASANYVLGENDTFKFADIQIEQGTTATEYEQYGASPSPDYPAKIENVEGKNKLDYKTVSNTSNTVVSLIENGFNVSGHFAGKVVINNLKKNTNYYLQYLTQNITGTAKYVAVFAGNSQTTVLKGITSGIGGVFNTGENTEINIWFYGGRGADKIGEAKFTNIQLEEGTIATPYVPYNSLEIKDIGENLLNITATSRTYSEGVTITVNKDKSITISGTNTSANTIFYRLANNFALPAGDYTLSNKNANVSNDSFIFYDNGNNFPRTNISNATFTKDTTIKPYIKITAGQTVNNQTVYPMILKGTYTEETIPVYKPYQEQKVDFPLSEGQKLYEGSYLASDGIHHKRKQIVLKGTENWAGYEEKTNTVSVYLIMSDLVETQNSNILSNRFQKVGYEQDIEGIVATPYVTKLITIKINKSRLTEASLVGIKNWLETQYSNGTPVIVEYELSEEEIVPYTTKQQEAWNKIEQLHTYKNVTNIFSDAELDIVYVRDNGLSDMYETKQNASKNYTKTVEKFAEQKITTDEINQKVAVVNEKLTEYKQDIDGFSFTTENAGGINLIQNSTLENGLDLYHSTTGTVSIEKNIDVKEKTISKSAIKIINGTVITQEINIIPLEDYTFSCLIYKTELTNVTIKIVSDKIEEYKIEAEPETWQKFSANINSSDNSVIIEIICDNNFCYISDRILNKGNAPLGWQRHNGEFKSDNVTINEDGITVTNTNDNMKHVITSSEDKIINTLNGKTEVSFNPDETKMNSTRINEKLTKGKVRETVRDDGTVMVTMDD